MSIVIDGRTVAAKIREDVEKRTQSLHERGTRPSCTVILGDGDRPGLLYAQTAQRSAQRLGIRIEILALGAESDSAQACRMVQRASDDPNVHGVILQRPLARRFDEQRMIDAISPGKDVDGAHPLTYGLLAAGRPTFIPATAAAVMELLRQPYSPALESADAVVIGRSRSVGAPVSILLTAANATVMLCHSHTRGLAQTCRRADILVSAVGKPNLVTADMIKPGATVIDVGTTVQNDTLIGDVEAAGVSLIAEALTPVPGGVGPVTTAIFLRNIVQAAEIIVRNR